MADTQADVLQALTADIISAYVSKNKVGGDDLARLIGETYAALSQAGSPPPEAPQTPKPDKAAIRKSIQPDHLVSFVDGRRYKSLKRHLTTNGMTADEYRERYGLPRDYPTVAASYSAARSQIALSRGLGRNPSAPEPDKAVAPARKAAKGRASKAIKPQDETFT